MQYTEIEGHEVQGQYDAGTLKAIWAVWNEAQHHPCDEEYHGDGIQDVPHI